MSHITKGVFSNGSPPEFTRAELDQLCACFGGELAPAVLDQAWRLRQAYWLYISISEEMATLTDVNVIRREWAKSIRSIDALVASTARDGKHFGGDQALRQLLRGYGRAVHELLTAASNLRAIVTQSLDDAANIRDIRNGEAPGLRLMLWLLHEPVEAGVRRGESFGLAMGPGTGRGAPALHMFLSIITQRKIDEDDVRYAIDYLKKHDRMPRPGNSPSGFGGPVTEFPDVW